MRELERDLPATNAPAAPSPVARLAIVGAGRVGGSIAGAAGHAGISVEVVGRRDRVAGQRADTAVLLCVPDREIAKACAAVAAAGAPFVGHTSGASGLDALEAARAAGAGVFSLHPLQTIPDAETELAGAPCAVAGSDDPAREVAHWLASACDMVPFAVPEDGRAAYHAAATMASNFLIALEESAAGLLAEAGVEDPHEVLTPLVLRTAANWSADGAAALTGPIARGDDATVARHLEALREHRPDLVPVYEALAERTRAIARGEGHA